MNVKELHGIGAATAKKMAEIGIDTIQDLATWTPKLLAEDANMNEDTAFKYINMSYEQLREDDVLTKEFISASDLLQRRMKLYRLSTGSSKLDNLFTDGLGNLGLESGAVTEFYAEFGSGKSQLCHTISVLAQLPPLETNVIYIDTEGTFRPERIKQIAEARELPSEEIVSRIKVGKMSNSSHLELTVKRLNKLVQQFDAKLVIIDSIMSLHRDEFSGRGTLADRQQRLNNIMHKLVRVAEIFNVIIVITNQVQSSPDPFGDPIKPVGGNVIGHSSTYRVYIRKSGKKRIARMVDSPYHEYGETPFNVTIKGIEDLPDGE